MKKYFGLIVILIAIIVPLKVEALCSVTDKMRYNSLATNIVTSYDYVEKGDDVSFNVTIHNVHRDLVVVDKLTNKKYQSNNSGLNSFTISGLNDGKNYSFAVYAKSGDCSSRLFNTLYVNLPKYNKYYKDPICDGASDYLLCQKWTEIGSITYEEFKNDVENYKGNHIVVEDDTIVETNNWLYIIGDFWAKYYLYILGAIIVVTSIILIIIKRRDSYDF